jgi:hypothetical protein
MLRPEQKRHNNMPLGKHKSGLECIKTKNLAQAIPIDSFSYCSKSRITLGREMIQDIGKNARQNLSLSSSQSPFVLPMALAYHCFAFFLREKGNNFHFRVSYVMPEMLRHKHISSNSSRWWQGSSLSCPEKGCARTMAIKLGQSPQPDERLVLKEVVAQGTRPLKQKDFELV